MTRTSPVWVQECVVIYLRIPRLFPCLNEDDYEKNLFVYCR